LYSLLHIISIHYHEYPLLLKKKKLNLLFPSQTCLDCAGATDFLNCNISQYCSFFIKSMQPLVSIRDFFQTHLKPYLIQTFEQ